MELPSIALQRAVDQLSTLPGVGRRSALRFALHLMHLSDEEAADFVDAVARIKTDVKQCQLCHCISDADVCAICSNVKRNKSIVCVVENVQEVMAIENTMQYQGLYHVLGGVISPIDGVGIHDLTIDALLDRVRTGQPDPIEEVILALPTTMEGDTTNYYIAKQLRPTGVTITTLARGVAIGDNLEYTDQVTLGRSITNRVPF